MPARTTGRWRAIGPLTGVGACVLLAAVLVDPFGEFLPDDDGFAYARSVQYLLHSGEYKLDAWSAANMPVQIYVAAGLSKVFGYSLDLLKLTTVGMLGVGLASFYGLARELRAARWTSFAATVALLASPLVLLLTFSFQSDVQFMGWLMLALFLYVRGIRQDSDRLVFLGSLAAACAIGTRQLGVAIIGGLMVAWVLARREDRPRLRTLLLAAVIPTVAAALQFRSGLQEPTFTQVARLYEQRVYLEQPPLLLAQEFVWRLAIVLQYVGISLLPALPLVVAAAAGYIQRSRPRAKRLFQLTILIGLALCASLLTGSPLTEPWPRSVHWPWPPLGLEWLLHTWLPPDLVLPIDLVGLALATVVGALGVAGLRALGPIRRHRPETILLASIPVIMFGLHLAYPQLNDTYILSFVPFALLLLVIQFRESATLRLAVPATGVALTVILIVSLMLRADFAAERTRWAAADRLVSAGVPTSEIYIYASWGWMNYHGAFDEWIAAGHPGFELRPSTRSALPWLHDAYIKWGVRRSQDATSRILDDRISEPGWRLLRHDSYRGDGFQRREIFTYARKPT